jgi:hypothetical protein
VCKRAAYRGHSESAFRLILNAEFVPMLIHSASVFLLIWNAEFVPTLMVLAQLQRDSSRWARPRSTLRLCVRPIWNTVFVPTLLALAHCFALLERQGVRAARA